MAYLISLLSFLFYIVNVAGQSSQYLLKFSKFNQFENALVEFEYYDFNEDSVIKVKKISKVLNGKFEFEGNLLNPAARGTLLLLPSKTQFLFVVDTGVMHIERDLTTRLNKLKFSNSKTNILFIKRLQLTTKEILNGIPINGQTIQDVRMKEIALLTKDSNNFYGLIGLYDLSGLVFSLSKMNITNALLSFKSNMEKYPLYKNIDKNLQSQNSTLMGQTLPEFSFLDTGSRVFTSANLTKKPYLISFGASWCGPCKQQLPKLKEILTKYSENKLGRIYINMDDDTLKWKGMIKRYQLNEFINLTDIVSSNSSKMVKLLDIVAFPTYIIITEDRKVFYNSIELKDFELDLVTPILNKLFKYE